MYTIRTMTYKIALAEDDVWIAEIYSDFLKEAGYSVTVASNGQELQDVCAAQAMDLVILDILMPVKTGYEVLTERLQGGILKDTPVIVLTGLNAKEEIEKITALGADDYFDKTTVELEPLLQKITSLLQ